jgi:hypothetical protein
MQIAGGALASVNQKREPAHSVMRRTVCACYGHSARGPSSASPAPLGPFCFGFGKIPFGPTTYVGALAGGAKFRAAGNTEILELTRRDL